MKKEAQGQSKRKRQRDDERGACVGKEGQG